MAKTLRSADDAVSGPSASWLTSLTFTGDSDDTPISVLLQNVTDWQDDSCDHCHRMAEYWPVGVPSYSWVRPAAMYRASLYCADCMPFSFDGDTGEVVSTLTGIPA